MSQQQVAVMRNGVMQSAANSSGTMSPGDSSIPMQFGFRIKFGDDAFEDKEIGRILGASVDNPVLVEMLMIVNQIFDGQMVNISLTSSELDGSDEREVMREDTLEVGFAPGNFAMAKTVITSDRVFKLSYEPATDPTNDKVIDAVTNTDASLESASADFKASDVGLEVSGAGITAGTTIATRVGPNEVTLSAPTTATATDVEVLIHDRIEPSQGEMYGIVRFGAFRVATEG